MGDFDDAVGIVVAGDDGSRENWDESRPSFLERVGELFFGDFDNFFFFLFSATFATCCSAKDYIYIYSNVH